MILGPRVGRDVLDLPVGHRRQLGEDVAQVVEGIESPTPAGFDDRVEDGVDVIEPYALTSLTLSDRRAPPDAYLRSNKS